MEKYKLLTLINEYKNNSIQNNLELKKTSIIKQKEKEFKEVQQTIWDYQDYLKDNQ